MTRFFHSCGRSRFGLGFVFDSNGGLYILTVTIGWLWLSWQRPKRLRQHKQGRRP